METTQTQNNNFNKLATVVVLAVLAFGSTSIASQFEVVMLRTISSVESNNGRYTNHETIETGLNAGTSAYGQYGLMPITILEVGVKTPSILKEYPELASLELSELHDFMDANPELELKIASSLLRRLLKIFGQNPQAIGYAWLNGITGTKRALAAGKDLSTHWHVKKIMAALDKLGGWSKPTKDLFCLQSLMLADNQPGVPYR